VAGLSFELLRFLAWIPENKVTNVLTWPFRAPGLALQRLTTYIPDRDMAEVALAAFKEVQLMDENPNLKPLKFGQFRYSVLREYIEGKLAAVIDDESEVKAEADWLFVEVTGYKRSELQKLKIITNEQYKHIAEIVYKRTGNDFVTKPVIKNFIGPMPNFGPKPLAQVLGTANFYGEDVKVTSDVLTPRPETEVLAHQAIRVIERAIERSTTGQVHALDLCTGSGAIALTLSKNTNANIVASDICDRALAIAKENLVGRNNIEVIKSDLFNNLTGKKFDLIVSNPPYIPTDDINTLASDVKNNEPHKALDGGADGLDFYRRIAKEAKDFLNIGGSLLLEVGYNQANAVKEFMVPSFKKIEIIKDLEGIQRIVKASL